YPTTKIRVNATCRKCPHKVHRMEMKTAISCTILRHTKILIAVGVLIISLATLGSKNHTTNITKIVTKNIGIIIKRLKSVVSQRESVKNDKPTISMSLSHCIHQTLNSKASTRFHSGGLQQSRSEERRVGKECRCRWVADHEQKKLSDRDVNTRVHTMREAM